MTKVQTQMQPATETSYPGAPATRRMASRDEEIARREMAIYDWLEYAGLTRSRPASATEPWEAGMGVRFNPETEQYEISTSHEVLVRFGLNASDAEIEMWIERRSEESMVW